MFVMWVYNYGQQTPWAQETEQGGPGSLDP